MTNNQVSWKPPPWEPPLAGSEVEHVVGALERLRATFRFKTDGLDAAGLKTSIGGSTLTLGGLLKHLAVQEDHTFRVKLSGEPLGSPWDTFGWDGSDDWEFMSAAGDTPEQLYAFWDDAVERSRATLAAALADGGLDQFAHVTFPQRSGCQPAPARLRPDRGVRPPHRPRRPHPRSRRRSRRRGSAG